MTDNKMTYDRSGRGLAVWPTVDLSSVICHSHRLNSQLNSVRMTLIKMHVANGK
jgi:hypothetical protein